MVGGRLRCMTELWLAAQIMYYERRKNRYTHVFIPCRNLVSAVVSTLGVTRVEADSIICVWGDKVHIKFVNDNQRSLVDVSLVPTLAKLTDAVVGMQGSVASMAATVAAMASQQSVFLEMMIRRGCGSDGNKSQNSLMNDIFAATVASKKVVAEVASSTLSDCSKPVTLSSVQSVLFYIMNSPVFALVQVANIISKCQSSGSSRQCCCCLR